VGERHFVINVTTDTSQLLHLDDLWTATSIREQLVGQSAEPGNWIGDVQALVDEMHKLLDRVSERAEPFNDLAQVHAKEAEDSLNALVWADLSIVPDRDTLRWWTLRHGNPSVMAAASASLLANPNQEHRALNRQLERLQAGAGATGDLSRDFACGAIQQLMVASFLLVPGVAAAGIPAVLVASGGTLAMVKAALSWAKRHNC
jgi:hypothetical protein